MSQASHANAALTPRVHAAVDDHSRLACAEVLPDEQRATCAEFLLRAWAFDADHGITILRVISDNALNCAPRTPGSPSTALNDVTQPSAANPQPGD